MQEYSQSLTGLAIVVLAALACKRLHLDKAGWDLDTNTFRRPMPAGEQLHLL